MKPMGYFEDPFLGSREKASDEEKYEWSRLRRTAMRDLRRHIGVRMGRLAKYYFMAWFVLGTLGASLVIIQRSISRADGLGVILGIVFFMVPAAPCCTWYIRNRRIERAISELAAEFGGKFGLNRETEVLDWLEAHWPAETTREIVDLAGWFERRWDMQATHEGRSVLMIVQKRMGDWKSKGYSPAVERISFYISGKPTSMAEGAGAVEVGRELLALGYWMKRTPAGVFLWHTGISHGEFEPGHVRKVLGVGRGLVE